MSGVISYCFCAYPECAPSGVLVLPNVRATQPLEYFPTTRHAIGHFFRDRVKSTLDPAGGFHCRRYHVVLVARRSRLMVARSSSLGTA
jgi:hypothetical protein